MGVIYLSNVLVYAAKVVLHTDAPNKNKFFSKKPQRNLSFPLFARRTLYDKEAFCLFSSRNLLFYWPENGSKFNSEQSCSQICPTRLPHPIRMFEDTIRQSANILIASADTIRILANTIRKMMEEDRAFFNKKEKNASFAFRNSVFCAPPHCSAFGLFEQIPCVLIFLTSILRFTNVKIIRTK